MNHDHKLLGFYNYTVVLTYIGMLSGFFGIVYAFEHDFFRSVICLMFSGFCDMFDGTIASTKVRTEQEKCFGIQIDSLSDLICFGVLPASIVFNLNERSSLVLTVCAVYVLCALIRLAYFNVDEQERQKNHTGPREIYYGLPVTLSALFVPLIFGLNVLLGRRPCAALTATLFTMALFFLLPVPLRKPKIIGKICVILCGLIEVFLVIFACTDV